MSSFGPNIYIESVDGSSQGTNIRPPNLRQGQRSLLLYLVNGMRKQEYNNFMATAVIDTIWRIILRLPIHAMVFVTEDFASLVELVERHQAFVETVPTGKQLVLACHASEEHPFIELAADGTCRQESEGAAASVDIDAWLEKNQWTYFEINLSTMRPTGAFA